MDKNTLATSKLSDRGILRRTLSGLSRLTCSAALLASCAGWAAAQEVMLRSKDNTAVVNGRLIEFDGERYRIEALIGEMIIDASQVDCVGDGCPAAAELSGAEFAIAGESDIIDGLIQQLLNDYAIGIDADATIARADNRNVGVELADADGVLGNVAFRQGDSTSGLNDVVAREALLAVASRPVNDREVQSFQQAGLGNPTSPDQQIVVALDGLVIVTSPENPVASISEADIAAVFSGQIRNWADLGGRSGPINLYVQRPESGSAAVFNEQVMRPNGLNTSVNATVLASDREVAEAVAADPNGIGFSSYSAQANAKPLSLRGTCGIQTAPNAFSIKAEEYPFTRRISLFRPSSGAPALANNFVDYVGSIDAQPVINNAGFVDQGISLLDSQDQGLRYATAMWPTDAETTLSGLGEMVQELLPAKRLSLTFRFNLGSSQLDARALRDINRLANVLAAGDLVENKELLLVGFTDSIGAAQANRFLGARRAETVRDQLQAVALPGSLDRTPIRILGFGEMSPLSCNDTDVGRQANRRVEVWVREIAR